MCGTGLYVCVNKQNVTCFCALWTADMLLVRFRTRRVVFSAREVASRALQSVLYIVTVAHDLMSDRRIRHTELGVRIWRHRLMWLPEISFHWRNTTAVVTCKSCVRRYTIAIVYV